MVDPSNVPHAELESDLVLHMHYKGEVLYELRGHLIAFNLTNIAVIGVWKPVHEPELDHKAAVDLSLDLMVQLLLHLVA